MAIYKCLESRKERILGIRKTTEELLNNNGVVVLKTDTIYGLGAYAFSNAGTNKIFKLKNRSYQYALPVLVSSYNIINNLVDTILTEEIKRLADAFWPGALTIILPEKRLLQWDIGDNNGTVAIRIPNDINLLTILDRVGPMCITSANISGYKPALSVYEAMNIFKNDIPIYLDYGDCKSDLPSTIINCINGIKVIREGLISKREIEEVLNYSL